MVKGQSPIDEPDARNCDKRPKLAEAGTKIDESKTRIGKLMEKCLTGSNLD